LEDLMSKTRKSDVEEFSDVLVLAALERAQRHQALAGEAVPIWKILEHLDVSRRSAVGRGVRASVHALTTSGLVRHSRRHGVEVWRLTQSGRRCLRRAYEAGGVGELPESPQHRAWRNARSTAEQEFARVRRDLGEAVVEMFFELDGDPPASSDVWFGLGERLRRRVWVFGSMTHCLYEWAEPGDARADIDDHKAPGDELLSSDDRVRVRARRSGRRNQLLWRPI
jgi:hypothetical protein